MNSSVDLGRRNRKRESLETLVPSQAPVWGFRCSLRNWRSHPDLVLSVPGVVICLRAQVSHPPNLKTRLKSWTIKSNHLLFGQFDLLEILFSSWVNMSDVTPQGQEGSVMKQRERLGLAANIGQPEPYLTSQLIKADNCHSFRPVAYQSFSAKGDSKRLGFVGHVSVTQLCQCRAWKQSLAIGKPIILTLLK